MIRYLEQEEKLKTREMYETNFPEDSKAFVDYYYTDKTKDNEILVMEEDKLEVMIQLNPYSFHICGEEANVNYIVAVATDASARRQGKMALVMKRALTDMAGKHQPFTFLIPANPRVYESSGFVFVPSEKYEEYAKEPEQSLRAAEAEPEQHLRVAETEIEQHARAAAGLSELLFRKAEEKDIPAMAAFANRLLEQEYDIFPYHREEYYERTVRELESQNGALMLLTREENLVGVFSYGRDEEHMELQEILVEPQYRSSFSGTVEKWLIKEAGTKKADRKQPEITDMDFMVRILDLKVLGLMLRSDEPFVRKVQVSDEIIPANNGCYEIRADREGSSISMIPEEEAECSMDIGELTEFLFGKMKLFVREWV